ncbi:hypothetical protein MBM_09358 [Drepanopeziza brunnea f. sp. 'multigermtubi' MB_m1]|uniref:Uncharacterized protein n=1 Tax=Marssonina brunnea f. sp. multigermtubi (strain MB_m1) TaxID=1072389 RepID=K1WJU5_MARBU|nr:uncharacterized protein MBM_09358 [Drepanopeziza brunnea f. sp. 'multigermtubi' MB_m1]EKD12492.1 hypothetical protein MBM_09358 [Drepanopeziza brunnea f. sp. 'multigermtubi' MB_m1]
MPFIRSASSQQSRPSTINQSRSLPFRICNQNLEREPQRAKRTGASSKDVRTRRGASNFQAMEREVRQCDISKDDVLATSIIPARISFYQDFRSPSENSIFIPTSTGREVIPRLRPCSDAVFEYHKLPVGHARPRSRPQISRSGSYGA